MHVLHVWYINICYYINMFFAYRICDLHASVKLWLQWHIAQLSTKFSVVFSALASETFCCCLLRENVLIIIASV